MAEHPAHLCPTCLLDGPCGASSNTLGRGLEHCRVRKLQGFRKIFKNGPVIKCLLWGRAEFGKYGSLCRVPALPVECIQVTESTPGTVRWALPHSTVPQSQVHLVVTVVSKIFREHSSFEG